MKANSIDEAMEHLKEVLLTCMPAQSNMVESVRDMTNVSVNRHVYVIDTDHSVNVQATRGGAFEYRFPGTAGREAARLVLSVLWPLLADKDWVKQPEKFMDRDHPNWGHIRFAVDDGHAGLLVMKINEVAEKISAHKKQAQKALELAEKYGPALQNNGRGKLDPQIHIEGSIQNPQIEISIKAVIADALGQPIQNKLIGAGIVPSHATTMDARTKAVTGITAHSFHIPSDKFDVVKTIFEAEQTRGKPR